MGEWLLSWKDRLIVARYEVPLQFGHLEKVTSENLHLVGPRIGNVQTPEPDGRKALRLTP
jgi:hypothetical protein